MHRSLTLFLFACLLVRGFSAAAQDRAEWTTPAFDALEAAPADSVEAPAGLPFDISGAVDLYYLHGFNGAAFPTSFTSQVNGLTLGMANIMFSKTGEKVGFVADLAFGPRAEAANGFAGTSLSMIKQLYLTYSPYDWLTLTGGNFGTFVGYELIDAPKNINYSTSYMFSNGPFYHTGIKADFVLGGGFAGMLGVFGETDSKFDLVPGKHLGAQLSYGIGDFKIYLNYLMGKTAEADSISPETSVRQFDITATYQLSEKLGLGFNATQKTNVIAEGDNTSWSGAALYANYAFSDLFTLGFRGEYMGDADGLISGLPDNNILALTLSGNIHIGGLTIIPEFRMDSARLEVFPDDAGKIGKTLPGFLVAAVYAF